MLNKQVERNLLEVNNIDVDFLESNARKLIARGVSFCDFYLQNSLSESWALDEGIIKSGSFAINQGVGVRAICDEKTFLSYSNAMNQKQITSLVDGLYIQPSQAKWEHNSNKQVMHGLYDMGNPLLSMNSTEKIDLLLKINTIARALPFVTNVIASLSLEYEEIFILRSDGRIASDIRPLIHLSVSIIVNKNGRNERGSHGGGSRSNLGFFNDSLLTEYVNLAHIQAMLKVDAVDGPSGSMPVVLGNGWAGVILHEAIGHGLEGDFNRKGTSAFSGKIGTQVASSGVTIIDDGTIANRRGSLNIDDEGNQTQRSILIENGILKGYMFDELNARLMNTKSTGNGRRESFACAPMPRMTNTFMLGGDHTPDEVINSVENGLYASSFEGGQVDITSGQFVFNASVAWVIKNGKLDYPVKGCALVGNGPECLKHVSMIANDMCLDSGIGVCGKDGQSVPVGVGQPTIRLDGGLVVGGGN